MDQLQQHGALGALLLAIYFLQGLGMSARTEELWAALPREGHRCTRVSYGVSVSAAVVGFLLLLSRLCGETRGASGRWFAAFVGVGSLWLPLALLALRCPEVPVWRVLVRLQLWLAAFIAVLWMLEVARLGDSLALLGAFLLAGNSCWMDALSWPCMLPADVGGHSSL